MRGLFLHIRWFIILTLLAVFFVISFFVPQFWLISLVLFGFWMIFTLVDLILLFFGKKSIQVERQTADRWHLGEANPIALQFTNEFGIDLALEIIDELPIEFQKRDFILNLNLAKDASVIEHYELTPLTRGTYSFGNINVFVMSKLKLLKRRIVVNSNTEVKVYPTTKFLKAYQLNAISDQNNLFGAKKIRKLGHSLEFEQIKEYVTGDDIRTVNWKATARRGDMMVNTFTDIRSQQIYCIIDKGRTMKMPFEGMSLMEYAIKATLVFLNVALYKHDKAGLISFSSQVNEVLPAESGAKQLHKIVETLYNQQTTFQDSDFEKLFKVVHQKLNQRCFLMLFTNFESLASLERQLPYLRALANRHMLCVIFFENTAIKEIVNTHPDTIEGIYTKTIAERFHYEKKQMVKELRRYGIIAILTTPEKLTVDVINNYLELKSRQLL